MALLLNKPKTWKEICESVPIRELPYKVESDEKGNLIMSPMFARHGFFQAEIAFLLKTLSPDSIIVTECAVKTGSGTKVADVGCFTKARWMQVKEDYDVHISPEIAIEVLSLSNSLGEMEEKKNLYLDAGSQEFWVCDLEGNFYFYTKDSKLQRSQILPDFPIRLEKNL